MAKTVADALIALEPNAQWTIRGAGGYSDIQWRSDDITIPTEDAVNAKITELEAAEPMEYLREVRNAKLAETDWIVIKEREEGGSVSNFADWKTYRQALRDITDSATSLDDVTWPEKPE